MQPLLPQIIVGSYHALRLADVAAARPRLPPNVFMLRRQSFWANVLHLVEIMRLLGRCLGPILDEWQPVLLMDTAPVHFAKACLRAAATAGVWVLPIPAKTTWLLQPLGTHVFARYKAYLRNRCQQCLADHPDGVVSATSVLHAIADACAVVLPQQPWAAAFEGNGFGAGQQQLRASVLRELDIEAAPRRHAELC